MWQMIDNALVFEADIQCPFEWIKVNVKKPIWLSSHRNEIAQDRDSLFRNYRRGGRKNKDLYERAVKKKKEV